MNSAEKWYLLHHFVHVFISKHAKECSEPGFKNQADVGRIQIEKTMIAFFLMDASTRSVILHGIYIPRQISRIFYFETSHHMCQAVMELTIQQRKALIF